MSGKFRPFSDYESVPRGRRLVIIVWLFVGIVVCLLVAAVYSVELLSAGRAFVGAEGQWSRAQKDAVFYLSRYAQSPRRGALRRVPARHRGAAAATRKARLELDEARIRTSPSCAPGSSRAATTPPTSTR